MTLNYTKKANCLCQDCLAVVEAVPADLDQLDFEKRTGNAACPECHGDLCYCSECRDQADRLVSAGEPVRSFQPSPVSA